jgi:hypothetical protein
LQPEPGEDVSTTVRDVSTTVRDVSTTVRDVSTTVRDVSTTVRDVSTTVRDVSTRFVRETACHDGALSMLTIPSLHNPSVIRFDRCVVKDSKQCVKASIPQLAVTEPGALAVSSGSMRATDGSMRGERRLTFCLCSYEANTAFALASAPVPEVVGIAMYGSACLLIFLPAPIFSM